MSVGCHHRKGPSAGSHLPNSEGRIIGALNTSAGQMEHLPKIPGPYEVLCTSQAITSHLLLCHSHRTGLRICLFAVAIHSQSTVFSCPPGTVWLATTAAQQAHSVLMKCSACCSQAIADDFYHSPPPSPTPVPEQGIEKQQMQ